MMPGAPRFLDLVTVWCLAFEILTRTAIELPAAAVRELTPPAPVPTHPDAERDACSAPYLSPAERELLEGAHAGARR